MQGFSIQTSPPEDYQLVGDYQLVIHPKLGDGTIGKVFYGFNVNTKQKVAAKQINTTAITASLAKQI